MSSTNLVSLLALTWGSDVFGCGAALCNWKLISFTWINVTLSKFTDKKFWPSVVRTGVVMFCWVDGDGQQSLGIPWRAFRDRLHPAEAKKFKNATADSSQNTMKNAGWCDSLVVLSSQKIYGIGIVSWPMWSPSVMIPCAPTQDWTYWTSIPNNSKGWRGDWLVEDFV